MQVFGFILGAVVAFGILALVVGAILRVSAWAWRRYRTSSDWLLKLFFGLVGLTGVGFVTLLVLSVLQGLIFGTD